MIGLIYCLFVFSGFIGLIYESTWSRYLKLFLGHASYGQILTLSIFMGGLGIGAFLTGKYCKYLRNPLYTYALVELFIGIGGFAYHQTYLVATGFFYNSAAVHSFPPLLCQVIKILISVLITAPMAVLLGVTFPCLVIGVMRITRDAGKASLPWLYFTNSLGAAIGVMVNSYYLVPRFGTTGSLTWAASGNIVIAVGFYFIARKADKVINPENPGYFPVEKPAVDRQMKNLSPERLVALWFSVSFLTGLSSFIYEVGWLRLLSLLLGSSTHSFDIMISAFILGLATGGFYAKSLLQKSKNVAHTMAAVQILMGAFAMSSIYLYKPFFLLMNHSHRVLARSDLAYSVYTVFKYILCLLLMFPTSFFAGMTLPLITYLLTNLTRDEKYTGSLYGWNTLGSILGAVIGGLVLLPSLQLKYTLAAGAMLDMAIGLVLLGIYRISPLRYGLILSIVLLVTAPVFRMQFSSTILTSGAFRFFQDFNSNEKILVRDGKTATISFSEIGNVQKVISTNGKPDASLFIEKGKKGTGDEVTQAALAFLPLSIKDRPYEVAVIGMGSGMTAHHLLSDPLLRHLDVIEIEEEVYHLARGFLPDNKRVYEDNRVSFVFEDARTFFYAHKKRYDIIISEPSNPWVSGVSNLFTQEFYTHIRRSLNPDGLLVQWMHLYEFNSELLLTILKAIDNVFSYVKIYRIPGVLNILIVASQNDFHSDGSQRFAENPEMLKDFKELGKDLNFFGNRNYLLSTQSLKPLLKYYNANSDFFPLVDNGAEKAFFLRSQADLFSPFTDTVSYYQEILEPESFPHMLREINLDKAGYVPDATKMDFLLYLLKQAHAGSDWPAIERLFDELVNPSPLPVLWDSLEAVKLYRKHVLAQVPPRKIQLKFLLLDHILHNDFKDLREDIQDILETFKPEELSLSMIRTMAVNCLKLRDFSLYRAVIGKFALTNPRITEQEKILLLELGSQKEINLTQSH